MGVIRQLPEDIAIKIAAGEVVERPSSVVKELVENALDAGATKVEVSIKDGGKTYIEVKDNGSGMDRDDAIKAFLRHGTSKIRQAEDLSHITTLGFRGEALAAIAASAEGSLVTCETDAKEGTVVAFRYGELEMPKPYSPLPGTVFKVDNLFAALPARQKFLKSDITEWKACLEVLTKQIIAHPAIAFEVKHNDRLVYSLPANQSFKERVAEVWKLDATKLIEVSAENPHMSITGIVVKPEVAHEGKGKQFFAVNGHPVNDKMVIRSIRDAYGTLLPPAIYPSFALSLTIHPGVVDVNIHPRKDEVRFINSQEVYRFVLQAVSQSLEMVDLAFSEVPTFITPSEQSVIHPQDGSRPTQISSQTSYNKPAYTARRAAFVHVPQSFSTQINTVTTESLPTPLSIVTIDQTYLVTNYAGKMLIVDQHAAHERILYHHLVDQDAQKRVSKQALLIPASLELNEQELAVLQENKEAFEALGFEIINSELRAVPQIGKTIEPLSLLQQVIAGMNEDGNEPELKDFKHKLIATMACKAAIKAGDEVSEAEKQKVIRDLMVLPDRYTCPHGRPSHVLIDPPQLEKLFKRTGF